jgi:RNA 2',3'-cyclic 3'-phosphodiesterase
MSDGKRLFLGVPVSLATANALARCAETCARRARDQKVELKWVAPASYHVTLKFLGWTRDDAIAALRDRVRAEVAGTAAFAFRTARLGAFPSLEKGSVLWAGIEDGAALVELAGKVERATAALGFLPDRRPFHPHVTLARLRETRPLRDVVLPMSEQMFSDTRVEAITLYESETKSSGSVYKEISRIGFKAIENAEKRQTGALELGDETEETDDGWPTRGRQEHT